MNDAAVRDTLLHQFVYSLIVAGKSATFARSAIARVFSTGAKNLHRTLAVWVADGALDTRLRAARTGNYTKLVRALTYYVACGIDLRTCTVNALETIPGVGPKTSRFFLLWTRPTEAHYAALDVHVLRWLRSQGYDAPRQTPANRKKYAALEAVFLGLAKERGVTPAQLDAEIWEDGRRAYEEKRTNT